MGFLRLQVWENWVYEVVETSYGKIIVDEKIHDYIGKNMGQ